MATKKKKSTKTAKSSELLLELDGQVYIVEKKNGKEVSREPLDGTVVLKCLLYNLEEGLRLIEVQDV